MTIGEKIRQARICRGLSQAELSQMLGLGNGGERISQYEKGTRNPKPELLQKIADLLEINIDSLSDTDLSTSQKTLHALFELENKYSIYLRKEKDGYALVINDSNPNFDSLIYCLDHWLTERQKEIDPKEYEKWKLRYPFDINTAESAELDKINRMYSVKESSRFTDQTPIKQLSEFLDVIIAIIMSDIEINCLKVSYENSGQSFAVASFNTDTLLNTKHPELFADYLVSVKQLSSLYGMEVETKSHTYTDKIFIDYYFKTAEIKSAFEYLNKITEDIKNGCLEDDMFRLEHESNMDLFKIHFQELSDQGMINS